MELLQSLFKADPDPYDLIWASTDGWIGGKQFLALVQKKNLDFFLIYVC